MLNAPKTCPWKCDGSQASGGRAGSGSVVQDTTNMGAACIRLWVKLHNNECECSLRLSTRYYNFQELAVQLSTINKAVS